MLTSTLLTLPQIEALARQARRMKGDYTLQVCGFIVGRYTRLNTALVLAKKLEAQTDADVKLIYVGK